MNRYFAEDRHFAVKECVRAAVVTSGESLIVRGLYR
jgi:hypothetical protein